MDFLIVLFWLIGGAVAPRSTFWLRSFRGTLYSFSVARG